MNIRRLFISAALGLAALKVVTLLYGAIEVPIIDIKTSAQLDGFLKDNPLAVIQFHDPYCPVCQAFQRKGIFKRAATALPHIKFAKVSFREGKPLHTEYKIKHFPTFILFRNGKQVEFTRNGEKIDRFAGYTENPTFTQKVSGIFAESELAAKNIPANDES